MARWSRPAPGQIIPRGCANSSACCARKRRSRKKRLPPSAKQPATPVYIESGRTRTFACAYDWPGWCRSAKGEEAALAALASYAPRYAPVAKRAKLPFDPRTVRGVRVVERIPGSANTDFGVPHEITKRDTTGLSAASAKQTSALVNAAWDLFDEVAASSPDERPKGPGSVRRDREKKLE